MCKSGTVCHLPALSYIHSHNNPVTVVCPYPPTLPHSFTDHSFNEYCLNTNYSTKCQHYPISSQNLMRVLITIIPVSFIHSTNIF